MKVIEVVLFTLVMSFFSSNTDTVNQNKNKGNNHNHKITICHIPPGNPANMHEITISLNALQTHLDHGDIFCGTPD